MEMIEDEDRAKGELKRIDHLVFVTLKYTRTVDVIRSIVQKFISAIDFKAEDYLNFLFEAGKLKRVPPVPLVRVKKMEELHQDDEKIKEIVDFYVLLKKIIHSEYKAKEEYRKNVTLVTPIKDVNIAVIKEYGELIKEYISYIDQLKQ
jgi:hypothetical protein